MNTNVWPRNDQELRTYGQDTLAIFISEFTDLLVTNAVDVEQLPVEWASFKQFWLQNMTHLKHVADTPFHFVASSSGGLS